jgi:hypothetical protein
MAQTCHVYMEDDGRVGEDDGVAAWWKTSVSLLAEGRCLQGSLLTDSYSGNRTLRVVGDQFGLDRPTARALLLEVYEVAGTVMRSHSLDQAEAYVDLESLIRNRFYRAQAEGMIQRIFSNA